MANMFFPQLSSGAVAQYPVDKERVFRTVHNLMRDGSLIAYPDSGASTLSWTLAYSGLSHVDTAALKALFDACCGSLLPFTFLDPTGNALAWSSDLTNSIWQRSSLLSVTPNAADPAGGKSGFSLVNKGQGVEEITQTVAFPSNYQCCFSLDCQGVQPASVVLVRRGTSAESQTSTAVPRRYARLISSGALNDGGQSITVGIRLAPGQSINVYGPQLEAQMAPSTYRATTNVSSVYPNCFWSNQELAIVAEAPNSYSAVVQLESTI